MLTTPPRPFLLCCTIALGGLLVGSTGPMGSGPSSDDGGAEPDPAANDAGPEPDFLPEPDPDPLPDVEPVHTGLFEGVGDPPEEILYPPGAYGGSCDTSADCEVEGDLCTTVYGDRFCTRGCTDDEV